MFSCFACDYSLCLSYNKAGSAIHLKGARSDLSTIADCDTCVLTQITHLCTRFRLEAQKIARFCTFSYLADNKAVR